MEDYDVYHSDKETRILVSHCDLCNGELPKEADNFQNRINVLDDIDDRLNPSMINTNLDYYSSFCKKEYNIPSYFIALG